MGLAIWQRIVKWFAKRVWPQIRILLERVLIELVKWLVSEFRRILKQRQQRTEAEADAKAESYAQKAETAQSEKESEDYRRLAQVWREVAESLRSENEELAREIDRLKAQTEEAVREGIAKMQVDDVFATDKGQIALLDKDKLLQLPPPDRH